MRGGWFFYHGPEVQRKNFSHKKLEKFREVGWVFTQYDGHIITDVLGYYKGPL